MKISKIIKWSLITLVSSLVLARANDCQDECWRLLGQRLVDCLDWMGTSTPWYVLICQGGAGVAYTICMGLC